jgi:hypothetical protein
LQADVSRSSVGASDDCDAPHLQRFDSPNSQNLEGFIQAIVKSGYLPTISPGHATWSVTSALPIAVVAQEWKEPRMLFMLADDPARMNRKDGILQLRFNYHAQTDPEVVFSTLRELRET